MKVCVIGAGCTGITAIKNLLEVGITNVVCYEKNDAIGGNWIYTAQEGHSSVCETTHIISSKTLSAYRDFPMPNDYPDYPSHRQVLDYFRSYAEHFGIYPYIKFNTAVEKVEKIENERWKVTLSTGEVNEFDQLMIANGHHSVPIHPTFAKDFTGDYHHSHSFKNNKGYEDKRVLVVGAGNSACDCAVEISRVAQHVGMSMRSGQYIIPKFIMGQPADVVNLRVLFLPMWLRNILLKISLRLQIGKYEDYQLPVPNFPVTKAHPTMNSELLYKIRHGAVHPRKGVEKIQGKTITFSDGTSEEYDTLVAATGYHITFPFFDKNFINYENSERIELYLRMLHPEHPTLFFMGLVQPQGCVWPISDWQAKLVAQSLVGRSKLPKNIAQLAKQEADQVATDFHAAKRHAVEVHYHSFIAKVKKHL
ncbi:MAG: hypothetical protein RLZZ292_898 [Bacteroidota bacterium]|jgi:cation diffusion facilitator CzcD-associated flavoprotein CzcO